MNNELRRRAAFWRNTEYNLDCMFEEVQARGGDKWFNEEDAEYAKDLIKHLGNALKTVRERFYGVLEEQVDEWNIQNNQEAKNENSSGA